MNRRKQIKREQEIKIYIKRGRERERASEHKYMQLDPVAIRKKILHVS